MNITKFQHACMMLEKSGTSLVIDPGKYTNDFTDFSNIAAILVTHSHPDHIDVDKVQQILAQNPDCVVYSSVDVARSVDGVIPVATVAVGQVITVGDFSIKFTGGQHALIHESISRIANLGLLIDDGAFFYPGDSLTGAEGTIAVLALPVSAPWLKIGEAIDFLKDIQPAYAFPVHDAILSETGKNLVDGLFSVIVGENGVNYQRIADGSTKEFN